MTGRSTNPSPHPAALSLRTAQCKSPDELFLEEEVDEQGRQGDDDRRRRDQVEVGRVLPVEDGDRRCDRTLVALVEEHRTPEEVVVQPRELQRGERRECGAGQRQDDLEELAHHAGAVDRYRQVQAGDVLLTSQLRAAIIFNKSINSRNYTLETINKKIYIFGIAYSEEERAEVIKEAEEIHNVKEVIPSIYLVDDLSRNKL